METIKLIISASIRDLSMTVDNGNSMKRDLLPIQTECYLEDMAEARLLDARYPELSDFNPLYYELTSWFRSMDEYYSTILKFKQDLIDKFPQYKFVLEVKGNITERAWFSLLHTRIDIDNLSPLAYVRSLVALNEKLKLELRDNE